MPWSRGAINLLHKQGLHDLSLVRSELKISLEESPDPLPFVQNALSNATSLEREHTALITAFTSMDATHP